MKKVSRFARQKNKYPNSRVVGKKNSAVLMDLSKAFDCIHHDLLILKLEAYGLSKSALNLMHSYLSERKRCVKVGVYFSTWKNIYKGEPQGSILGPVLFKIFLNDTFNFVEESILYNYADDITQNGIRLWMLWKRIV